MFSVLIPSRTFLVCSMMNIEVRLMENRADLNATVPPDRESPLQLLLRASHMEGELVQLCKSRHGPG